MAYSQELAHLIRIELKDQAGIIEKKMFGGIAFLLRGNMACGVLGEEMIVRVGADRYLDALGYAHTRPFDMTGRPMKGWVMVGKGSLQAEEDFRRWVAWGVEYAETLPPK